MANDLDSIVEAYEQARAGGEAAELRAYLPDPESDSYRTVALELMRVDLEYSWQAGAPRGLEYYLVKYGEVLQDPSALAALAFEDYRLRRAAGQPVHREDYSRRYRIDVRGWPDGDEQSRAKFPRVGERLLGFHLQRELGRGAFGRVYLAEQEDLAHRQVAVKVTTELTVEPERLAELQHANIVPIYSLHRQDDLQVVCMPYYGDRTLTDWLRSWRGRPAPMTRSERNDTAEARLDDTVPVSTVRTSGTAVNDTTSHEGAAQVVPALGDRVEQALHIVLGMAAGLAHAHRRGIVHRDLKPANVLLRDDLSPLLLDFNLASDLRAPDAGGAGIGGTLPYMAPEQLAALETGESVDVRADVFACGVLFVEMLTGSRPFADIKGRDRALWRAMREERLQGYRGAKELARAASTDVASIAVKCLAPRPKDRYASAAELEEDVRRHLAHLPLRHAENRSLRERGQKWLKRHPRLGSSATVAAIAATLLCAALTAFYVRGKELARLDAVNAREAYVRSAPEIRAALTTPDLEPTLVAAAIEDAERLLSPYLDDGEDEWRAEQRLALLDMSARQELTDDIDGMVLAVCDAADRLPTSDDLSASVQRWRSLARHAGQKRHSVSGQSELARVREATRSQAETRRYALAVASARRWTELAPRDFEAQFQHGNALAGAGRDDEAEQCLSICTALAPRSHLAYFQRGVCRLARKSWRGAHDDFSRVLDLRPRLAAALLNRALAATELGDVDHAIADLTAAIETHEAPTRAYFLRAKLYARQGRAHEAQADREQGLQLLPNDVQSWVARGVAKLPTSPAEALEDFQSALRLNPADRNALQNSANVLAERLQRTDEAIVRLTQLLESRPADLDARAGRAVLYARLGRADEALADAVSLKPDAAAPVHCYQAACVYALLSRDVPERRAAALQLLAAACRQDMSLGEMAGHDADLQPLHADPEFQRILDAARCLQSAGHDAK